jgi:hypothetical protein
LGDVLDEESTCDGRVCIETYFKLVEEGKEIFLYVSGDGVVVPLKDGGKDGTILGLDIVDLLHVGGFEVGEAELGSIISKCTRKSFRGAFRTRLNFPAAYNSWIAARVSSIGVVGSGAWR